MTTYGPKNAMQQDVVRCDLCPGIHEKSPVAFHCTTCRIKSCCGCIEKHLSEQPDKKHEVVGYQFKSSAILVPNCRVHNNQKCNLHCKGCDVAVCQKCLDSSHKKHEVQDIENIFQEKKKIIEIDTVELEKYIIPEYHQNESSSAEQISKAMGDYGSLKSVVCNIGQEVHQEVDVVTNKVKENVEIMEKKDLGILRKQLTEMKTQQTNARDTLYRNREILRSNDADDVIYYKSRNEEFRRILPHSIILPPDFKSIKYQGAQLVQRMTSRSEIAGFVINKLKQALSSAKVLDKPYEISSFVTNCSKLYRMTCLSNDDIWVTGETERQILRYNMKERLLETYDATVQSEVILSLTVTGDDDLVYSDAHTITILKKQTGQTEKILQQKSGIIAAICISTTGDILAIMTKTESYKHKISRYVESIVKWEKMNDDQGYPLLAEGQFAPIISENKSNLDICVCDINGESVVVLDKNGKIKFRYQGNLSSKKYPTFKPHNITTDRLSHILVLEPNPNNCIHVLDHNGQFISYIDNCGLQDPSCLCVNSQDHLVVGERITQNVRCFKYLE